MIFPVSVTRLIAESLLPKPTKSGVLKCAIVAIAAIATYFTSNRNRFGTLSVTVALGMLANRLPNFFTDWNQKLNLVINRGSIVEFEGQRDQIAQVKANWRKLTATNQERLCLAWANAITAGQGGLTAEVTVQDIIDLHALYDSIVNKGSVEAAYFNAINHYQSAQQRKGLIETDQIRQVQIELVGQVEIKHVRGDGNCFYSSVSEAIGGAEKPSVAQLRQQASDQLAAMLDTQECDIGCQDECHDRSHTAIAATIGMAIAEHNSAVEERAQGQVPLAIILTLPLDQLQRNFTGDRFSKCKTREQFITAITQERAPAEGAIPGMIQETPAAFCQAMLAFEGPNIVYATTPDIQAMAAALGRRIWVIQQKTEVEAGPGNPTTTAQPFGEEGEEGDIFVIKMRGEDHFNLLQPNASQANNLATLPRPERG